MTVHDVLRRLPDLDRVRDVSRAIAMLDAALQADWSSRYFSFDTGWAPGEELASMRDGSGDEYSIVFTAAGACARGFAHESPMSPHRSDRLAPWPGLPDAVPAVFRPVVEEPAFAQEDGILSATVLFWRETGAGAWRCGPVELPPDPPDADGADELFAVLADGRPEAYQEFAASIHEQDVDLGAVRHAYDLRPLTRSVLARLNPDADLAALADLEPDRKQIGYPAPAAEELAQPQRRSLWGWPLL